MIKVTENTTYRAVCNSLKRQWAGNSRNNDKLPASTGFESLPLVGYTDLLTNWVIDDDVMSKGSKPAESLKQLHNIDFKKTIFFSLSSFSPFFLPINWASTSHNFVAYFCFFLISMMFSSGFWYK